MKHKHSHWHFLYSFTKEDAQMHRHSSKTAEKMEVFEKKCERRKIKNIIKRSPANGKDSMLPVSNETE